MTETRLNMEATKQVDVAVSAPAKDEPRLHVSPGPHLGAKGFSTRRMMLDVLIALTPLLIASVCVFKWLAVKQVALCIIGCIGAELIFTAARRRSATIGDLSAVVTGVILAMSLPGTSPWYVTLIAAVSAVGFGKFIFGGLGHNLFNPAMVGRAFAMMAFTGALAAGGYVDGSSVDVVSQATPMTAFQIGGKVTSPLLLLLGNTNGSLGETSAVACVLGGVYLLVRRVAAWQIPVGMLSAATVWSLLATRTESVAMINLLIVGEWSSLADLMLTDWTFVHHLLGGALLFGAFFIATDPVTSPLTPKGRFIFGVGIGSLVILMRTLSAYPEGVMFAVLLMNAIVPLINRWTIPTPVGGKVPKARK